MDLRLSYRFINAMFERDQYSSNNRASKQNASGKLGGVRFNIVTAMPALIILRSFLLLSR